MFQKERRQVVALCLIQESIDYSLFHYIVEVETPIKASNILKKVFSEEPVVEESDFASRAKYLASRSRRQRRRSPSTLQGRNSSLSFFNEM